MQQNPTTETPSAERVPLEVGSLLSHALFQVPPDYPQMAKKSRIAGVVKVEITVDENGDVATIHNVSGPMLLRQAARNAVRKWKFEQFTNDAGEPVQAKGYVNFNFFL